jgi:hypothetical protein
MARVDVLWTDETGTPRVAPAKLDDKSESGMCVRLKDAIGIGTHITVKRGSDQVSGTVANCRFENGQYVVGVKRNDGKIPDPK